MSAYLPVCLSVSVCLLGELICGQGIIIMITDLSGTHVYLSVCLYVSLFNW